MRIPYYPKPGKNNKWKQFSLASKPKEIRDADIIMFEGYVQHKQSLKRDKWKQL